MTGIELPLILKKLRLSGILQSLDLRLKEGAERSKAHV